MTLVLRLLAVAIVAGMGLPFRGTILTFVNPAPPKAAVRLAPELLPTHNAMFRYDGLAVPAWIAVEAGRQGEIDARSRAEFAAVLDAAIVDMTPPPAPEPAPVLVPAPEPVQRPAPAAQAPAPPAPAYSGSVPDLIRSVFAAGGQGAVDWGLRVAKCESGFNTNAYNAGSGASGVFQFLPSTWRGTPYASSSIFDASANVHAALWLYQRSGPNQWSCT